MKKIFLLVFAFVMCKIGYAQYPMTQFIGTDSAIVVSKGAMQSRFVNVVFADTTTANSQRIKQYPGAMIYAAGKLWYRNATATGWVELTSTSTDTNIYNSDGALTGNRELDGDSYPLTFSALRKFEVNGDSILFLLDSLGNYRTKVGNQEFIIKGDTASFLRRISYGSNLGSSFTKHSLIDKNYVDSSFSLKINGTINYVPKFTSSSAIGNSTLQTDANGNFGINVTPSNWSIGGSKALEIRNQGSALYSQSVQDLYVTQNAYYDVGWKYNFNSGASFYLQTGGNHEWHVASPGSSGSSISFLQAMVLTSGGGLGLGTSSPFPYKLSVNGDVRISTILNATTDTDRFIVSDGGVIKYRTGSEVLSDIGGASASSISGTPNYIAKFTGSSSIGNTVLYEDGFSLGLGTTAPSPIATGFRSVTINGTNRAYVTLQVTGLDLGYFYAVPSTRVELSSQTALPLVFSTNATERMRLDASGNLGLGVTPSAWISTYRALQIGFGSSIVGRTDNTTFYQLNNAYRAADGTNYYLRSGETATQFAANLSGQYIWYQAPSGTAGNAISFTQAMTLDASGNLLVGGTSVYGATITSYGSATRSGGLGIRNSAGTAAGFFGTYAAGSGSGSTDISVESAGFMQFTAGGSERMRITSNGNVGVGIVPTAYLGFVSSAAGISLHTNSTSGAAGLNFYENSSGRFSLRTLNGTAGLSFFDSFNGVERARIDASGNLGLGATSPVPYSGGARTLNVYSSTTIGEIKITNSTTGNAAAAGLVLTQIGLNSGIFNVNNGYLNFATNETERMRITSGGDVGIGTSSPGDKLHVVGNVYATAFHAVGSIARFVSGGGTFIAGLNGSSYGSIQSYSDASGTGRALSINPSGGNVGIGTTSPAQQMEIKGAAGANTTIQITSNNINDFSSRIFFADNVSQRGYIAYSNFSNFLAFGTNSAEVARFTSAGELLINTTSDAGDFKLQVSGNAYVSGSVGIGSTSVTGYTLRLGKTMTGSTVVWGIQNGGIVQSDVTNTAIYFNTAAATQATAFTLTNLYHYGAGLSSIGAGSSITNQYGYFADNTLVGATNNYGFYGNIASGTGRWNLYMNGTANNYMNGNLGIGVTTPTEKLEVNGAIKTAAPSGGTAAAWKLGSKVAATVSLVTTDYIEVEIGGVAYKLALVN